jgi:hypothetical protein
VAFRSAEADLLTSWVTIASRLVIFLRHPFSTTVTQPFRAALSRVDMFLLPRGRPFGLPDRPF